MDLYAQDRQPINRMQPTASPLAQPMPVAPRPPIDRGTAPGRRPSPSGTARPPAPLQPVAPPVQSTGGDGFGSTPQAPSAAPTTPQPIVDRFALAQDRWNQFQQASEPAYQSALRQANRLGAAGGQLGAGELRTDFGNLAATRSNDLTTAGRGFLSDALEGTIGDNQRGFQNELARLGLTDDLLNSAFGRALQTYQAGNVNNPTRTGLEVGGYQAGNAQRSAQSWADLLRNIGSAAPVAPAPAPTTSAGTGSWQPNWDWRTAVPGMG